LYILQFEYHIIIFYVIIDSYSRVYLALVYMTSLLVISPWWQ